MTSERSGVVRGYGLDEGRRLDSRFRGNDVLLHVTPANSASHPALGGLSPGGARRGVETEGEAGVQAWLHLP